jgi:hypothetical protein
MKKTIRAFLAVILCFTLVIGVFVMTGCDQNESNGSEQEDTDEEKKNDGKENDKKDENDENKSDKLSVVVLRNAVAKGARISSRDIEIKEVEKSKLPRGYLTERADAIGKFAASDLAAGTALGSAMLSDSSGNSSNDNLVGEGEDNNTVGDDEARSKGFVVITDYVEVNAGRDVSAEIQQVINENPQKTIYFPDGEYLLANPIATSGNPANAVALQLSNFAVLKAMDGWNHSEAMVRLGGAEKFNNIHLPGSNYYLEGGCIDGNMVANGVSIDSGRETSIRNVSIKRTYIGLHIKHGANSGSSDADIETVNIVGNAKPGSIGVLIDGYDNTLTNMRIAAVQTGVKIVGAGNFLRNIHPLYIYAGELAAKDPDHYDGVEYIDYSQSVAFHEISNNNWYDICYSDQFAVGFKLGNGSTSLFDSCFCFWYSNSGDTEIGFQTDGRFNAMIVNSRVVFRNGVTNTAFLKVGESGGSGVIQYPIFSEGMCADKCYRDYLDGKVR